MGIVLFGREVKHVDARTREIAQLIKPEQRDFSARRSNNLNGCVSQIIPLFPEIEF